MRPHGDRSYRERRLRPEQRCITALVVLSDERLVIDLYGGSTLLERLLSACPIEAGESVVCLPALRIVAECLGVELDRLGKREALLSFRLVGEIIERPCWTF